MSHSLADFQKRLFASSVNFGDTKWAMYRLMADDDETFSREAFLAVGPRNKLKTLPEELPLSLAGYELVGWFDINTLEVTERFVVVTTPPDPTQEQSITTTNNETEGWFIFEGLVKETPYCRIDAYWDGKVLQTHYAEVPKTEGAEVEFMDEDGEGTPKLLTLRETANALKGIGMSCNCDLDNWEPEKNTGHSRVCQIHKRALEIYNKS